MKDMFQYLKSLFEMGVSIDLQFPTSMGISFILLITIAKCLQTLTNSTLFHWRGGTIISWEQLIKISQNSDYCQNKGVSSVSTLH